VTTRYGAALLLEVLRSEGCALHLRQSRIHRAAADGCLIETPDISYIWALQEASVVAMTDGYAQAAGRPGFVDLHTAGGLGQWLRRRLNASVSGTPLVVTAGQQDSRHMIIDQSRHRLLARLL
jgi:benzoylformate decarboxylase